MKQFNFQQACDMAWEWCWQHSCEGDMSWRGQRYLTATELANRIRCYAAELERDLPYGELASWAYGIRTRVSAPGRHGLLWAVRDWLQQQVQAGRLTGHNFRRGHCSGMRFRPVGDELTAAEQRTLAEKSRPALVHFADLLQPSDRWFTLCSRKARETSRKKVRSSFRSARHYDTQLTRVEAAVTCPRCLKLLRQPGGAA